MQRPASTTFFLPRSLPAEYGLFVEEFKRTPGTTWIMKPVGRAQGKEFSCSTASLRSVTGRRTTSGRATPRRPTRMLRSATSSRRCLSEAASLTCASTSPSRRTSLKAWVIGGGFCRFSAAQYDSGTSGGDLDNLFVHLTNNAIQKTADTYNKACDQAGWRAAAQNVPSVQIGRKKVEECFFEIQMVMIRACLRCKRP